jgi:dipeptidyl aminopeptidase/acylaminoacyl peptidase
VDTRRAVCEAAGTLKLTRIMDANSSACRRRGLLHLLVPLLQLASAFAWAADVYQKAPPAIREVLDAPATPVVSLSPTRDRLIIVQGVRYPPLADLAEPMLRLAGYRINPLNNGPSRPPRYVSLALKPIPDGPLKRVSVPSNSRLGSPAWSPDGKMFAFARYGSSVVELWVVDAASGATRRLRSVVLNAGFGEPFQWMPDSQTLLCKLVPADRGRPPAPPRLPAGPTVQESDGKPAVVRTYQDLLGNTHDEALFDYYARAQLALVNVKTDKVTPVGKPSIFNLVEPSPDGRHLLIAEIQKPYSYLLPASGFPQQVEVWDRGGNLAFRLANIPEQHEQPLGGVMPGPRRYHWRPTAPATLAWVEALDGGDSKRKVTHRDRVVMLKAPFAGLPEEIARTEHRFSALTWGEKSSVALVREYQSSRRWQRTWLINPDQPQNEPYLLWDQSAQDRYNDPGAPLSKTLPSGHRAMRVHDNALYLAGSGASPSGDRPFLDRFDLTTLRAERLFQSDESSYESVVALVKDDASQFITRHESAVDPPNYFLRQPGGAAPVAMTRFADPALKLRAIQKQLVTYTRDDGVELSFTLYLPPDYQPGTRLPTLLWAYPREYNDADNAGQITGSTNRFTTISGASHLFFALHGYAVLDGATMPVVGSVKTANDTYLEQITASARAAIQKAAMLGVTDPDRVGVGGHSYGAFMTANLLAHSDLFRAGIARSGAYNRTLTPFGFQSERRTIWEAPEMYLENSPFLAANKINEPLLLIHGELDNNSGTFPIQSERLYEAIKGNGGTARLVLLPYESHSYDARESIEHVLSEMLNWFDKHVKNASPP